MHNYSLNKIKFFNSLAILFIIKLNILPGQEIIYYNNIIDTNIRTVQIFREGWELSQPVIKLDSDDKLIVGFDNLKGDYETYHYTFIHCNSDWTASDLMQSDYMEGFYENPVTNYRYSSNTTVSYTHYEFLFPNNDIKLLNSGNYIVIVYKNFDQDNIIFTRRFFVYEPLVEIVASVKRPTSATYFNTGQEIDFSINHESYEIQNAYDELKVIITQNFDWENRIESLKPTFVRQNELVYDYNEENVFFGISEYRYFDIKSLRYQSEKIKNITYDYHYHYIDLVDDEERHFGKYFYNDDLNGKYLVQVQEFPDSKYEADYVMVNFSLPMSYPYVDGDIYVYGALTDWKADESSKMIYNYEARKYEKQLLLKQGYYNYLYASKNKKDNKVDLSYIEGTHYETENDYFILVYHHPFNLRYERLIGIQVINSVRKSANYQVLVK